VEYVTHEEVHNECQNIGKKEDPLSALRRSQPTYCTWKQLDRSPDITGQVTFTGLTQITVFN